MSTTPMGNSTGTVGALVSGCVESLCAGSEVGAADVDGAESLAYVLSSAVVSLSVGAADGVEFGATLLLVVLLAGAKVVEA